MALKLDNVLNGHYGEDIMFSYQAHVCLAFYQQVSVELNVQHTQERKSRDTACTLLVRLSLRKKEALNNNTFFEARRVKKGRVML